MCLWCSWKYLHERLDEIYLNKTQHLFTPRVMAQLFKYYKRHKQYFIQKNCLICLNISFLGFRHISLELFFYKVYVVKGLIGLMANIIWIFGVRPYALGFRNLVHIFQSLRLILQTSFIELVFLFDQLFRSMAKF